jgi:hypothetical protein
MKKLQAMTSGWVRRTFALLAVAVHIAAAATVRAAEPPGLAVELNRVEAAASACRLTFTVESALPVDVETLTYEAVLFDAQGAVAMLTLLDFPNLPAGALRVRQFDLAGLECDALGLLLFNGVETCVPAVADCEEATRLTSRTGIEVRQ